MSPRVRVGLIGATFAAAIFAGEAAPPGALHERAMAQAFVKNVLVTDKKVYVHFFWNAQDAKGQLQGSGKRLAIGRAALQLVLEKYPLKAEADLLKVDIVFTSERDTYGNPRWDTLTRVAHLELLRSKALERERRDEVLAEGELASLFSEVRVF